MEFNKNRYMVNIGTERSSFFVNMSKRILKILKKYPMLPYAIEQGVASAEKYKYYAAGILALSQMLNILNEATPSVRHEVGHKFLQIIPKESSYIKIKKIVEKKLEKIWREELKKSYHEAVYCKELQDLWEEICGRDPLV